LRVRKKRNDHNDIIIQLKRVELTLNSTKSLVELARNPRNFRMAKQKKKEEEWRFLLDCNLFGSTEPVAGRKSTTKMINSLINGRLTTGNKLAKYGGSIVK